MNAKQIIESLMSGARPIIEFVSGIEDMEGADSGMKGQIISVAKEDLDLYKIEINLKPYEHYNETVAVKNWGDGKLTWMETEHYPQDGIWTLFIDTYGDYPVQFQLVSEKSRLLMSQFLAENPDVSYVEWLESKIP